MGQKKRGISLTIRQRITVRVCNTTPIDRPGTGVLPPFKGRPGKSPLVELMLMMRAAADPPRPYRFSRGNAALVTRMGP
jgi:hypothetical protein